MDFKLITQKLLTLFEEQDIHYALIGGFALGAWGVTRASVDIDFLVYKNDMGKVHKIMTDLGYECHYKTENVSQYVSPINIFGEVDFLHAFRNASLNMIKKAEEKKIFEDTITIKVLQIEDLIGLKIQAIANDASRKNIDLPDIENLISINKDKIDWKLIEEYFNLFNFKDLFNEFKGKYYEIK
ncbi:nucleotidyltransferase [Candidatus Poribacteria bacterium]|nr:nucleotidyltransferase [Candidatus Poribacteria bacterium]